MRSCQLVSRLLSAPFVITRTRVFSCLAFLLVALFSVSPVFAQAADDDDAALSPAEPDYRVINLPTTLRLPKFKSSFELTHRFNGNLRNGDFGDQLGSLFGIDQGATMGFEFRFAPMRHVELAVYRENYDRTIQIYGKWDVIHQNKAMPVSVSPVLSFEGGNNFRDRYAASAGATISRQFADTVAVYVVPMWASNITPFSLTTTQRAFYVGLGSRLRVRPTVYLSLEGSPRLMSNAPNSAEYAFAIEKRAGAHVFQLNFGNSQLSTFAQTAAGGLPGSLFMGFNLTRKFF